MAQLNRNELETMRVLWEKGSLKPAEIQGDFAWPIENATLRSVLRVLMDKRLVTRRKVGKAYYYRAKASRRRVLRNMAQRMAHVFTGGSAADLIAQLIKAENLSKKEVEELRRVAAEKVSTTKSGGRGR